MTRRFRRFAPWAALAAVAALGASDADAATPTVKLLSDATVRAYPGSDAPKVAAVAARRPLTGAPTVLPVLARARANGRPWVRVRLPQRPNGTAGWIAADGTITGRTAWRIVIDRSSRRARVYRAGRLIRAFTVIVGTPATPTPIGEFFVAESVRQPSGAAVGPVVLALSAYSNVLQEFAGGPGQIGLHGRTGLPGALGTAASHGCVRFSDRAITWLAGRVHAGAPVIIRR